MSLDIRFPNFEESFSLDTSNSQEFIGRAKSFLIEKGGKNILDCVDQFEMEISSRKLMLNLVPLADSTRIYVKRQDSKTVFVVIRKIGEKRFSIGFLIVFTLVCIASFLQKGKPFALLMPVIALIPISISGYLPRPVAKRVRELFLQLESGEANENSSSK